MRHRATLDCFGRLDGHEVRVFTDHVTDPAVLAERLADRDVLVLIRERTPVSAELIEQLPHLQLISQRSVYPHIDVEACTRHGVVVCSDLHAGSPSYATAELTWALVLAAARRLPQQSRALDAGHWQTFVGSTLRAKTLGIYGYGRIGEVVAGYGRAFGMRVVVWARPESLVRAARDGWEVAADRQSFFADSDVITLHLRLVPATRHIVRRADLALMKSTAILVNTSRAGLLEPGALVAALDDGRPGAAAVDVYEHEPVVVASEPLVGRADVVCTPHLGYVTTEEWEIQFATVFDQINAFAAGTPVNVVNPAALRRVQLANVIRPSRATT